MTEETEPRSAFPTPHEVTNAIGNMTGWVRAVPVVFRYDLDGVHYFARCSCGIDHRVSSYSGTSIPVAQHVAAMLLILLDQCQHQCP
jgi:hypothetical protein